MATIHFDANASAGTPPHHHKEEEVPQTTIEQLLASTKASSLTVAKGKVIVVDSNLTPGEGFQILLKNNILGAPVFDAAHKKYIGFLDVRDLVDLVVHRYDQAKTPALAATTDNKSAGMPAASPTSPDAQHSHPTHLKPADAVAGAHRHIKIAGPVTAAVASSVASAVASSETSAKFIEELLLTGEVMLGSKMTVSYLSRRHPFRSVGPDATLLDVAKALTFGDARRVPIVDASGAVVNVVSQSTIIAFLTSHLKAVKAEAAKTVEQWPLGTTPVTTVRDNAKTIDAFRLMSEKHLSGLAVVNAAGSFVASTASADLKLYLNHPKAGASLLEEPILDFLGQLRQDEIAVDTRTKVPTLSVPHSSPLSLVIGRLAATKSHKIFVADKDKDYKPHAVISLTDVLRTILKITKPAAAAAAAAKK